MEVSDQLHTPGKVPTVHGPRVGMEAAATITNQTLILCSSSL